MLNEQCPEAVKKFLKANWEDVEPLDSPACIRSQGLNLESVWAVWMDDNDNFRALDYSPGGQIRVYIFTNAYPVREVVSPYEEGGISIQEFDCTYQPFSPLGENDG